MARADLLVGLIKAGNEGDREEFRKAAEAIIAEEQAKKHIVLADRLRRSLNSQRRSGNGKSFPATSPVRAGQDLFYDVEPRRRLSDMVVPQATLVPVNELIEEQHRRDLLYSYSTTPRHRVILAGPPGNGKTSLAEAIAYELAIPLYVVRYDALVGSFLGETGARLRQLFDFVRTEPCVLFFDEFDAVGKERGDTHETGEIKRVVSTLLMQVDRLPDHVVVIAASNHPELLDRAVWRRFQLRLELPFPRIKDITTFINKRAEGFDFKRAFPSAKIAKAVRGASFAEIEDFLLDVHRRYVLSLPVESLGGIVDNCLLQWKGRFQLTGETDDGRGKTTSSLPEEGSG